MTYSIPYTCQEDSLKDHTPRHRTPSPYYRDLRPKCVVFTATHQLYKIAVHGKGYQSKCNTS